MKKFVSLRFKLTIIVMLLLVICGGVAALLLFSNEIENNWKDLDESVKSFATLSTYQIVENYKIHYNTSFQNYTTIIKQLIRLNEYSPEIQLLNTNGKILFESDETREGKYEGDERTISEDKIEKIKNLDNTPEKIMVNKTEYMEVFQPYVEQGGNHEFTVRYLFPTAKIRQRISNVLWTISIGLAICVLAVFIIFVIIFSRILINPINKLSKNLKLFTKGKTKFEKIKSNDEIGELSDSFNNMTMEILNSRKRIEEYNKDLEKKVKEKTAELRQMDIKKNEFIAIAYREIKRPLTLIHGFAQVLQNKTTFENKDKREEYLTIMEKETGRLSKLISNMLELSRIDLEITKPENENVNVEELVQELKTQISTESKWKNKKLIFDLENYSGTGEKPIHIIFDVEKIPRIRTDREKLKQILENLVENAIEYTEKGFVKLNVRKQENKLLFSVEDSGTGISEKYHDKVFTRFFQANKTKSGGLGLAVCKEFVTLLGGEISFESEENKGSVFRFNLLLKK